MRFIFLFVGITIADAINPSAIDLSEMSEVNSRILLFIFLYAIVLDIYKKW